MGTPDRPQGEPPSDQPSEQPRAGEPAPDQAGAGDAAVVYADEVATQDQVRSLRRWLVVAGAWAVAATAIGLIALLAADDQQEGRPDPASAAEVSELSNRLDRLDKRVGALSEQQNKLVRDVEDNTQRLDQLQGDLPDIRAQGRENADMVETFQEQLSELEDRVAELEAQGSANDGSDAGGEARGDSP